VREYVTVTTLLEETMMFRSLVKPATRGGLRWIAAGLVIGLVSTSALQAQQPPAQAEPAKNPYVFGGDGALTLNFIKADKTADYEMVISKLKEALAKSEKPGRKQQATGWKVFKAAEPGPNGSAIYVSIVDPVVKGADYTVSTILSEAFPAEVQALYKTYSEAYVSQNIINLNLVKDLK
jgi:hypothetical protein